MRAIPFLFFTEAPNRAQRSEWPRMAEPTPPHSVAAPPRAGTWRRTLTGLVSLALVLQVALGLRVIAADSVDLYVHRGGSAALCLFPDTAIYWGLARAIRTGAPYEYVEWNDIPHFARRTPGYPLFLATCQGIFGLRTLAVRLVQAGLGTLSVYLIYRLTRQLAASIGLAPSAEPFPSRGLSAALVAAALAAINPYYLYMTVLILSEAVFVPLMLAALWGLAVLWVDPRQPVEPANRGRVLIALASGGAAGLAILVRPSWALFVPVTLVLWLIAKSRDRRALIMAARGATIFALGLAVVMSPWWVRNARIYGRFVPTALWMGASLYDGLNPGATGASDMSFLGGRELWPLDEQDLDAELTRRAIGFAHEQPVRALSLAFVKLKRFWSPWPNSENLRSPAMVLVGAVVELPLFGLMVLGAWDRRRDPRAWTLLAGPLLYFCALHLVFASSMRYRLPGEMPALGLAAIGWIRVREWLVARGY
jgi:4-amino-4-deoxy-L-arabinose transferase-like glycosyltransferase